MLVALLLRTFLFQPYNIPSGSMEGTLLVGDYLFVEKCAYGYSKFSLPWGRLLPSFGKSDGRVLFRPPHRGDVVVFRYPKDESVDYIKRVIGLPGDVVAYQEKQLTINGKPVPETPLPDYLDDERMGYAKQFEEDLDGRKNAILNNPAVPTFIVGAEDYPYRDNCTYNARGVICKVPPGNYFMMGDNRDNSADSRYWGFAPDRNIVGRAFFIWMNFSDLKRIGSFH